MPGPLHFDAPTALDYFAALVAEDSSLSVLEAAISIAQDEYPQLDLQAVLAEIDGLALRLKRRIPADAVPLQKLRWLNRYFYQDLGFAGNVNNYYDPANSYLNEVLSQRRGIPITLALLYIEFANQIGLPARGVSFPGHFLVKLRLRTSEQEGEVVIDPFTGESLSREDLDERLAPFKRRQGLLGDFDAPLGLFLQTATPRDVVARLLGNLKEIHRSQHHWPRLLAVLNRLVVLLPDRVEERRDRALVLEELGRYAEAADDLDAYVRQRPEAGDTPVLQRRLQALRAAGRPRLH